jgi:hypothetical protein
MSDGGQEMTPGFEAAGLLAAHMLAGFSGCAAVPPVSVDITFANNPPVHINALSRRQMARMFDAPASQGVDERFNVNGITVDQTTPKYEISYEATVDGDTGGVCLRLEHVGITIDYSPEIYIASEYRPGTCRYNQTMTHESRHVDTHIITVAEHLAHIKSAVQDVVSNLGVAELGSVADIEQVKANVADRIRDALATSVAEMRNVALIRQQQIDTRQEYVRLTKTCP